MIEKKDLQNKLETLMKGASTQELHQRMGEFLKYTADNYPELDPEAKTMADKMFDNLNSQLKRITEQMPEGLPKREALRLIDRTDNKHFDMEFIIKGLETPSIEKSPILKDFKVVFTKLMQNIIDQLYEISKNTLKGSVEISCFMLFYSCIDELLTIYLLSERALTSQAYSHIRTTFEIFDKIDLFSTQSQWIDVWTGSDYRKKQKELSPSAIRQKLGENKHDPIYSFFSEIGTHIGFKNVQARTFKSSELSEKGNPKMKILFAGVPTEIHINSTCVFCMISALRLYIKISTIYTHYLNTEEYEKMLDQSTQITKEFINKYLLEFAKEADINIEEFKSVLKTF